MIAVDRTMVFESLSAVLFGLLSQILEKMSKALERPVSQVLLIVGMTLCWSSGTGAVPLCGPRCPIFLFLPTSLKGSLRTGDSRDTDREGLAGLGTQGTAVDFMCLGGMP